MGTDGGKLVSRTRLTEDNTNFQLNAGQVTAIKKALQNYQKTSAVESRKLDSLANRFHRPYLCILPPAARGRKNGFGFLAHTRTICSRAFCCPAFSFTVLDPFIWARLRREKGPATGKNVCPPDKLSLSLEIIFDKIISSLVRLCCVQNHRACAKWSGFHAHGYPFTIYHLNLNRNLPGLDALRPILLALLLESIV